jgi:hypothetical protein
MKAKGYARKSDRVYCGERGGLGLAKEREGEGEIEKERKR